MTEPLPCPFCGHVGVSVVQTDHKWRAARCDNCGAQSGDVRWIYTEEDPDASAHARAIEEWNKRHPTIPEVSLTNQAMQDLRNRDIARMLRTQAWERAKGELRSMMHTFQSTVGYDTTSEYERLDAAVEAFITEIEDNGLQE